MGLSSLSTALSGLKINQQQIDVVSNNISNVGTEGYTRKILPQSTQAVDGRSIGVLGETIIRNVDLRLERDLWTQVSSVGFYGVQEQYLGRIDQFHGAPDSNISVAAEVSKLQDTFSALANSPDDQFLLADVVDQAVDTANKINDLADYYTTLRNDAQNEAAIVIQGVNDLLDQIAELNSQIRFSGAAGKTVAATQDARDQAVKELSELMEVSVYPRGDGVLVVQTLEGIELASEQATHLVFRPTPLSPNTAYPETAAGIYVGDPTKSANAIDITERNLGGRLGGLIQLRDETFPKQIVQLDELAHKLALRFEQQGLRLFTDSSGTIPPDTPPDISTDPPTPVEYIGFSNSIRVNAQVIEDPSLVQTGTYGGSIQSGANDVIRRIIEYTFGSVEYQVATNQDVATSVDIRASATGGTTLQDWLGLSATNSLGSGLSLANYNSVADVITAGGDAAFGTAPNETDTFILRLDDPDFGGGPYDFEIDLRSVPSTGTSAAQDLVDYIMADADWAAAVADFGVNVSVGGNGQLLIESSSNIEIVNSPVEPLSDLGFSFIGLSPTISEAKDPYFDVRVGNGDPVRITIEPGDTEVELLAKLNNVSGLAAEISADGFLSLRPGNSSSNPDFGGDISVIGGPFTVNGASLGGTALGRAALDDGIGISQALFGTYQINGGIIDNLSPIVDVPYQSETYAGSGEYVALRSEYLGPLADVDTKIVSSLTLKDFSQKIVNEVAQELALIQNRQEDETTLKGLLEQQLLNESGVNIDEELGNLIVIQTAYSASTRVITTVQSLFDELLAIL